MSIIKHNQHSDFWTSDIHDALAIQMEVDWIRVEQRVVSTSETQILITDVASGSMIIVLFLEQN